jgi:hypothetical protein
MKRRSKGGRLGDRLFAEDAEMNNLKGIPSNSKSTN